MSPPILHGITDIFAHDGQRKILLKQMLEAVISLHSVRAKFLEKAFLRVADLDGGLTGAACRRDMLKQTHVELRMTQAVRTPLEENVTLVSPW